MPPPKNSHIAWSVVIGGLLVATGGALINAFVILPIRDAAKARSAMAMEVHDLSARVESLEKWQAGMARWRERVIATTGIIEMRRAMTTPIDTTR